MSKPMEFFDPPPIRYFGAKWQLAEWIIDQFPPHDLYVEPYCGGASVFFRKQPAAIEVLNDLNGDLVHFFDVLRTRTDEFVRAIELTPVSLAEYERSWEPTNDPLERARRFYIRSWQAFGSGGIKGKTGWRRQLSSNRGSSVTHDWARISGLWLGAMRLKQALLDRDNALAIIKRYDGPKTLFYVDPPYLLSARARSTNRYSHEMDEAAHRELASVLRAVSGAVILSGYDSALYRELYADWRCVSKTNTTNGNSRAVEYLWISPNADDLRRLPLFAAQQKEAADGTV